jgi:hypothetical protein
VKQAGQDHPVRERQGIRLPRTVDAMLAHGEKSLHMTISAADQWQGMRNVLDPEIFRFRIQRIHMDPGMCCDAVSLVSHL